MFRDSERVNAVLQKDSMKRCCALPVHWKGDEKETMVKCNFDVTALCRVGA